MFAKFSKLIANEARKARGNREAPGLRVAMERSRAINMPAESIERAIIKATGGGGVLMEPVLYETYGPGGIALLIEALTDNRNRTTAEVKRILLEKGGTLTTPGAASWAFKKTPLGWEPTSTVSVSDEDLVTLKKLVWTLEEHEDVQEVTTNAE